MQAWRSGREATGHRANLGVVGVNPKNTAPTSRSLMENYEIYSCSSISMCVSCRFGAQEAAISAPPSPPSHQPSSQRTAHTR